MEKTLSGFREFCHYAQRYGPGLLATVLTWLCTLILLCLVLYGCSRQEPSPPAPAATTQPPTVLPDLSNINDVTTKKKLFFSFLRPLVQKENNRIRTERRRLEASFDDFRLGKERPADAQRWLIDLADRYRLPAARFDTADTYTRLLGRVDIIPVELALVQAAVESAWGASRFARQGNNLFGQWCFTPGCGMVPRRRDPGARHEVAAFPSVEESIRRYIHNLNTGVAYRKLRGIRRRQRAAGQVPEADSLAAGLERYSSRGKAYIADLRAVLRSNRPLLEPVQLTATIKP